MDEPRFLRPGDDTRPDAGLLCRRLEELSAVFRFAHCAGCDGDDPIDAVRFGQAAEFRQYLERSVHSLGGKRTAVQTARAEADHLLLAVDDFERQIRAHAHHDHVQRVGPDVDGGNAHEL
jgi:hypothetical protein